MFSSCVFSLLFRSFPKRILKICYMCSYGNSICWVMANPCWIIRSKTYLFLTIFGSFSLNFQFLIAICLILCWQNWVSALRLFNLHLYFLFFFFLFIRNRTMLRSSPERQVSLPNKMNMMLVSTLLNFLINLIHWSWIEKHKCFRSLPLLSRLLSLRRNELFLRLLNKMKTRMNYKMFQHFQQQRNLVFLPLLNCTM